MCGDVIDVTLYVDGEVVERASHDARACSLVHASADLLDRAVVGRSLDAARDLAARVASAVKGAALLPEGFDAIAPVLLMPARQKCVLLPWAALLAAIDER